ncbi:MAG: helix-hairpin-helix domain-containing protein [Planctomycetota bacterium]
MNPHAAPAGSPSRTLAGNIALAVLVCLFAVHIGWRVYRAGRPPAIHMTPRPAPAVPVCLDLNAASAEELACLPLIGAVRARQIVDFRAAHGPFRAVADLRAVPGLGDKTIDQLAPLLKVGP